MAACCIVTQLQAQGVHATYVALGVGVASWLTVDASCQDVLGMPDCDLAVHDSAVHVAQDAAPIVGHDHQKKLLTSNCNFPRFV